MEKVTKTNSKKNSKKTNVGAIKNSNAQVEKNNKKIKLTTFVVVLSITAAVAIASIVANVIQAISIGKLRENMGQTFLQSGMVHLQEDSSNAVGFSIINNIISGVTYPQKIEIDCSQIVNPQVLRVKASAVNADCEVIPAQLETTGAWVKGNNNYYYYNGAVGAPMKILLCNKVALPLDFSIHTNNKNKHVLVVVVEAIKNDKTLINLAWSNAPQTWLNNNAA